RYWHEGVDYPFVYQPVKTPMGGTLSRRPIMDGGYGNWVYVISGAMEMIFAHLRDFSRSPASGSTVNAGDVVGLSVNTG
ncbi:peptidoglycan DD-metalloendopeptidase family protein, partial [Staphylococcus felis]